MSEIINDGLDQYGPEHFGRLIFVTIRKCGVERVKLTMSTDNEVSRALSADVYRPMITQSHWTHC